VVLEGALAARGMASFRERFGVEETEALRAYITQRARAALPGVPPR
jgi:hypothetical protein